MSNLIIPNKIKTTLPKPTKTQLVEALLIKAKELHDKEEERKKKLRKEIETQLLEAGLKDLAEANPNKFTVCVNEYQESADIEFKLTSPQCKKLIKQYAKYSSKRFYESEAKTKILESFKPANPLLNNSVIEKSLEDLYHKIFNNINTIEAIKA